jgi:hypothetical protein
LTRLKLRRLSANRRANLAGQIEGKAVVAVWSKMDRYVLLLGSVLLGSVNANLELMRGGFA